MQEAKEVVFWAIDQTSLEKDMKTDRALAGAVAAVDTEKKVLVDAPEQLAPSIVEDNHLDGTLRLVGKYGEPIEIKFFKGVGFEIQEDTFQTEDAHGPRVEKGCLTIFEHLLQTDHEDDLLCLLDVVRYVRHVLEEEIYRHSRLRWRLLPV